MSQTLYRFYDREYTLLYVGITSSLGHRLGQHEASKPWWGEVSTVDVEHFSTREELELAEIRAIKLESPTHNVAHAGVTLSKDRSIVAATLRRLYIDEIGPIPEPEQLEHHLIQLYQACGFPLSSIYDDFRDDLQGMRK